MKKSFYCEQAQLDATFNWQIKPIRSGPNPAKYVRMGLHGCDGCGKGLCRVKQPDGLNNIGLCDFFREIPRTLD
jgi:hypothetical protein